jgi:hypothetical protein
VRGDDGFSMIATALALIATALLTAILVGTTLNSGGSSGAPSGTGVSNAPGVAQATGLQAQQTLSTGLATVATAAASGGGYGSLQPSALSAANPSITFVAGPSTDATTISVAVVGGAAGSDQSGIGGVAAMGGAGDMGGSVTLAVRATDGTCWLAWRSSESGTWYGAQTGQPSCTAPALASTPTAGSVSSSSIGWEQGSYPAP